MHLLASDENPKTLGYISTGDSSVVDVTSAPRPLPNVDFRESNTSKSEIIYLNALPNPNYKVRKPIEVTITYVIDDGIEFIAKCCPDRNRHFRGYGIRRSRVACAFDD